MTLEFVSGSPAFGRSLLTMFARPHQNPERERRAVVIASRTRSAPRLPARWSLRKGAAGTRALGVEGEFLSCGQPTGSVSLAAASIPRYAVCTIANDRRRRPEQFLRQKCARRRDGSYTHHRWESAMNKLVIQRFAELAEKANAILASKTYNFQDEKGVPYYKINSPAVTSWGTSVLNLLHRSFGEDSIHFKQFQGRFQSTVEWESAFLECNAVFKSAKEDYEGGYLFNMRSLIQAEIFDDALGQATELLRAGYKDPACVVAGVTLETTLKELCSRNRIPLGKMDKMNADLCKAGIYNMGMQKQITAWADRRNKAAHGDWTAYSDADVEDMIKGVNRLIAEQL